MFSSPQFQVKLTYIKMSNLGNRLINYRMDLAISIYIKFLLCHDLSNDVMPELSVKLNFN